MKKQSVLKFAKVVAAATLSAALVATAVGCGSPQNSASSSSASSDAKSTGGAISVFSREDGSGTRGAFIELFGIEEKGDGGKKVDMTTEKAVITNSTSVMMTSVAGDATGIGYISLGSLNDTVKAVNIDGAAATAENVKSGTYKISRPFNIVVKDTLSAPAQDFINFIMSAEGQSIVEKNGYIAVKDKSNAQKYSSNGATGKVVVAGSSSVTPVMEKLAEAYKSANPNVTVEVQQSDSSTGITMATEGTADIGMASRDLKDAEKAKVSAQAIAQDGIAVIVSPKSSVSELSAEQVKKIYTGEITKWSEL